LFQGQMTTLRAVFFIMIQNWKQNIQKLNIFRYCFFDPLILDA
jgi:hypothetical protein